jgi:hypothetical protein
MNRNFSYSSLLNYNSRCPPGYHYHPGHPKSDSRGCMKNSDMKYLEEFKNNKYCPAGYHYDPNNKQSDKDGCLKDVDTRCNIANLNINHNYGNDKYGAFSLMGALKYPVRYDNNFYFQGVS